MKDLVVIVIFQAMKFTAAILIFSTSVVCQIASQDAPIRLEDMVISVGLNGSREIAYTNKEAGVFYTETNGEHRSGWQGWRVMSNEILEGYRISIDGRWLNVSDAAAEAYPHQLRRKYPNGVVETFTLLDSIDAFVVELKNIPGAGVSIDPYFSGGFKAEGYDIIFEDGVLLIANNKHLIRTQNENYPAWIGLATTASGAKAGHGAGTAGSSFSPSGLGVSASEGAASFIFVAGDSKSQTASLAKYVSKYYPVLADIRKKRMEDLLNYSYVRTDNLRFNAALNWAKISMDALIMNQRGKGIFAGLPWFDNYWGRDSFISLAGATLVTGNFKEAKEILRSFAAWQCVDPDDPNFGRIPNLVTSNSIAYNTADGTPRFIIALDDYVRYSGDTAFARELYPVVRRSITGTLRHHIDSLGFLRHGEAETWMDAVGPGGPWSPRGDRANDVQALWYAQLRRGARWARSYGEKQEGAEWDLLSEKLERNFKKYFFNERDTLIADHLDADGTPDVQLRPNQLVPLDLFLFERGAESKIFQTVTREMVYPHGVASLWQSDSNFHPYHNYQPYYVPDASYHNGIIWTWLAGSWIDLALEAGLPDLAYRLTGGMVSQILDEGAVGTMSELIDIAPKTGKETPELSGTYSQAWSLAEFIRNFYQSYLGIQWFGERVQVYPSLPDSISELEFAVRGGANSLHFHIDRADDDRWDLSIRSDGAENMVELMLSNKKGNLTEIDCRLKPGGHIEISVADDSAEIKDSFGGSITGQTVWASDKSPIGCGEEITLARPYIDPNLSSLRPPPHRILTNDEIKRSNREASVLSDIIDPEGDDNGDGGYTYPLTANLVPGSLDVTRFTVACDGENVYFRLKFRNLSDPGWHPEYGFQLTYAAIAISKKAGDGSTKVGMNSNYEFTDGFKYQTVVYVGGGIRLSDDGGRIIAEYLPVAGDEQNPLGRAAEGEIGFSLPVGLVGVPDQGWSFAVLIGAQDDHGGAGIGEFRTVGEVAMEWSGGGKEIPSDPNIYDLILPPR